MQKTLLTIVLAVLCLNFSTKGQDIQPLNIGDSIPKAIWGLPLQVINHPNDKKTITLNDYKGKLIILDFWATWCTACIKNFPKIELLQHQFQEKLQVIAVTHEQQDKVISFFNQIQEKQVQPLKVFSITADTLMAQLFPHRLIPHYIWIGADGLVKAITSSRQITAENISQAIQSNSLNIAAKQEIDPNKPLFLSNLAPLNSLQLYSVLLKGNYEGLPTGTRFRKVNDTLVGRAFTNSSLLQIFKSVAMPLFVERGDSFCAKRLRIKVKEPTLLNAIYNYDVIVPPAQAAGLYHNMLNILNQHTGYTGTIVKQKEKCLVLIRTGDNADKIATKGGKIQNTLDYKNPGILINQPVSALLIKLNAASWIPLPVVDETQYTGNIDLTLSGSADVKDLRKQLKAYDLDLIETERMLNLLVLNDD